MSELVEEAPAQEQRPAGGAGRLLREARQAAGLHVAALAVSLKVPVRKLEALEQDRYEEVGDPVFVRALAASVCRALKAEAQPVLERLPQGARPRLVADSEGINTPFRAPGDGAAPRWVDQIGRPVVLAVGALLLGALLLLFLPMLQRLGQRVGLAGAASADASAPIAPTALATVPAANPSTAPASSAVATPAAPSSDAGAGATLAASASATPASGPPAPTVDAAPAQAAPAAVVAEPPPAAASAPGMAAASVSPGRAVPASAVVAAPVAASAAAAAEGILSFHTTGPSWIQVSDARGTVVLHRVVQAGETVAASGIPPFKVTVGKADLTQVQVRGRPFDLQPVTRENVARFEVK